MNSLLILFGESFRLGGQGNRNRGSEESYRQQINASLSHIKFIESLQKNNINMTVSINPTTALIIIDTIIVDSVVFLLSNSCCIRVISSSICLLDIIYLQRKKKMIQIHTLP